MAVTSPENIINQALVLARRERLIGDIYEGSEQASIALELYGQARDELLDLHDWSFSREVNPLTLLKGPPPNGGYNFAQPWSNIYPYPGFLFEYAYPTDCLDIRAIVAQPGPMPDLDPLPQLWRIDNDLTPILTGTPPNATAAGPPAKVIYCNAQNALAVYRARITNPASFDTGFVAALVASLAKKFGEAFALDAASRREDMAEAADVAEFASSIRG